MVMFDPLYVRPDDVGTQRNKALIMAPSDALQEPSATTQYRGESDIPPPVTRDRRKQRSRDRRQATRRQEQSPCLVDTRNNRERRAQFRRHNDVSPLESGSKEITVTQGFDEVV